MDKQEDIKRSKQSLSTTFSRNIGRSESNHIPPDLIFEILSRLPAKSIVRYRSVSKLWSSITTTPAFINSFASRCSSVLLILEKDDTFSVFSSPSHHQNRDDPISYVRSRKLTNPNNGFIRRYDSVHGLICFEASTQLEIWSPAMECFLAIRVPQGKYVRGFLGYDPIHGKFKALCILAGEKIGILTLGEAPESWRIISSGFPKHMPATACGRCINGVVYYKAFYGLLLKQAIMSFDVRSEKFNLIHYPSFGKFDLNNLLLVSYMGRLALVSSDNPCIGLWILEDAENHKWSYTHIRPVKYFQNSNFSFEGITDAGDFIYIRRPLSSNEWAYVVYYDAKEDSIKAIKSRGNTNVVCKW